MALASSTARSISQVSRESMRVELQGSVQTVFPIHDCMAPTANSETQDYGTLGNDGPLEGATKASRCVSLRAACFEHCVAQQFKLLDSLGGFSVASLPLTTNLLSSYVKHGTTWYKIYTCVVCMAMTYRKSIDQTGRGCQSCSWSAGQGK